MLRVDTEALGLSKRWGRSWRLGSVTLHVALLRRHGSQVRRQAPQSSQPRAAHKACKGLPVSPGERPEESQLLSLFVLFLGQPGDWKVRCIK